jgi:hypothetical protein
MSAMGNVLRILGIVVASMMLGLVALFLLLFSICGGLETSESGGVLVVCLLLIVAAVGAIVFLGRGITTSRKTAQGLAVPPAASPEGYAAASTDARGAYAHPESPSPTMPVRSVVQTPAAAPLGGTDQQVLIGLRIALGVYILFSVGSMAFNLANFGRFGSNVAIQLVGRSILSVLPPVAVLLAVSLRNPPAGGALDAAAGLGIASMLFRIGFLTFSGLFTGAFGQMAGMSSMVLRIGAFSALEMAIAGLALRLRSRLGPMNPVSLIGATIGFLIWDGLVQAIMQALLALTF